MLNNFDAVSAGYTAFIGASGGADGPIGSTMRSTVIWECEGEIETATGSLVRVVAPAHPATTSTSTGAIRIGPAFCKRGPTRNHVCSFDPPPRAHARSCAIAQALLFELLLDAVGADLVDQRAQRQAELLGRLGLVAVVLVQRLQDQPRLELADVVAVVAGHVVAEQRVRIGRPDIVQPTRGRADAV